LYFWEILFRRMNLIIDVGNTQIKMAVFQGDAVLVKEVVSPEFFLEKIKFFLKKYDCTHAIMSSVGFLDEKTIKELGELVNLVLLSHTLKFPFKNLYGTPETLGVDRLALIAAASYDYPEQHVLVIDAGTCITYDFISKENEYLGGSISLGLEMRFKALHTFTASLPIVKPSNEAVLIGNSTKSSMQTGVENGLIHEISGTIAQYEANFQELTVVLTGGDVNFLSKRLKNSIFANPNFLIRGLNLILTHNKS